jgi:DNA-binding NarL/FixJ family response regulator
MIKVLIADKQLLTREGIISILTPITNIQIIGDTTDPITIKKMILRFKPDVIIADHTYIPVLYTTNTTKIDEQFAPANFLILFNKQDSNQVITLRNLGIQCYICKESSREEILQAVYATANGEEFFCECTTELLADKKDDTIPLLSSRETEIIHLIADGLTNNEIADKLFLSFHTIKTHRKNIIKKLGFTFKNTAELSSFIQLQKA